ncbi:MAG: alpha/beta hydrolase [Bryobacterales bacterium]|nr:alpha/beta hydrolase [Bryobacterales bacterium]
MRRREILLAPFAARLRSAEPEQPSTFPYKRVDGCEVRLDVYAGPPGDAAPVAVWIHGGALIMGSRRLSPRSAVLRSLLEAGFRVVSIDYRLAPETKLPGIIDDVRDAFRWIRDRAGALRIDPARLAVCGGSAGGYLTLMTGFRVNPRPRALVSFWGYGDIAGRWYSRPDPFYLKQPAVSREEALAAVGKSCISEPAEKNSRGRFYLYCRQQGLWPRQVTGHDPDSEDRWFDGYCPIRNVSRSYPPTLLVHGTADTDVPFEQSKLMAERLARAGVEHRLLVVPDGSHGLGNQSLAEQDRIYREAAAFLKERV